MKRYILLSVLAFFISLPIAAQKELWGVNTGDEFDALDGYYGNITKYDINGENPVIMHVFDSVHGYTPKGKLFLASNGKLYGTCQRGGNLYSNSGGTNNYSCGVLYEYDLTTNQYRVVHNFEFDATFPINPQIGVIEPTPGFLYGATRNRVYKYNIATEVTTLYNPLGNLYTIYNEFIMAADGNLYSTSAYAVCPSPNSTQPWNGSIIKFSMNNQNLGIARSLNCAASLEGNFPYSVLETSPGVLYCETRAGGINQVVNGQSQPAGALLEYNIFTNSLLKKIDFNGSTTGGIPTPLLNGGNGKLYGLCEQGGSPQACNPTYNFGTLYEYTTSSGALNVKQNFNYCGNTVRYPNSLLKTSVGHFIGTIPNGGTFKWNSETNQITMPGGGSADIHAFNIASFIEICRKPSYHFFETDTYTICKNNPFTFDVQNTNATSYVWKKGGVVVANQTSGILSFANLQLTDSGDYTCEMVNECGTTVTMPLHLIVDNCMGLDAIIGRKNAITLYPNPAKNTLNIGLPENKNFTVKNVIVSNMLGQQVLNVSSQTSIGVGSLSEGIYIVLIQTDKGNWCEKFVKE
ncbi:choice-of-anchor tandem repeat GloVer-containing protein [Flavobacterium sp.]|uniref:choice-of-anchor tandem repeat GloVer-containing protein n=1 Tax=Flavobacterium sp. TaxID=239 RepID=UPI00120BD763|nr:choice-of-anchor tandem repeat GloVer-containing protein [Flavobacterium sp.]RZJ71719.1 MAG: T9SS type A sorting domain-containing protein [Flavobacterium sp.]